MELIPTADLNIPFRQLPDGVWSGNSKAYVMTSLHRQLISYFRKPTINM